jgi:peptidoglycan/LPS O-acetylase OafA/YrhL
MQNQLVRGNRTAVDGQVPFLDGIRGMAIFLVALGHFFCEIYVCQISWIGLNLFFVLSGFLITRCLFQYQSYSPAGYFRNFYAKRILRIFPLYYGVLIFFFLIVPIFSQQLYHYYSGLGDIQGSYWFYSSNWNMISNGLPRQPLFFHFWSLAVEEQFYVVWPILFLICKSARSKYIGIVCVLALSIINRVNSGVPLHAYLNSLTAAEPLSLGCLLCILQQDGLLQQAKKILIKAAYPSAAFLCVLFVRDHDLQISNSWLIKYGYSAIDILILAIFAISLSGTNRGYWRKLFSMNWLRWLGKYSYSIYVFHWIILQVMVSKLEAFFATSHVPAIMCYLLSRVIAIGITLLVSYCSYNYFEIYFLSLKKYFNQDRGWKWPFKWQQLLGRQTRPAES